MIRSATVFAGIGSLEQSINSKCHGRSKDLSRKSLVGLVLPEAFAKPCRRM